MSALTADMRLGLVIAQHLARCAAAMAEDASQGYMDKAAAMKYVKLESERALETWMKPVKDGGRGMPHMKIGETVRFSRARIDAWMLTLERNTPPLLKPLEAAA